MSESYPLGLFKGYGVELEYMIVRDDTLNVFPVADKVLAEAAGEQVSEVELGELAWSNELVMHVLEMKTNGPAPSLVGLSQHFQNHVNKANNLLESLGGALLPSAMHPWMDPLTETRLWPHEQTEVYHSYDRIFSCRGHGWSNLQSTHINLPFANDEEFIRLHAAIRVVLALIPAISAASPFADGKASGLLDTRLEYYRLNQRRIPSLTGLVIPEVVHSMAEYRENILQRLYRDISSHDPDGILQHEWLNSRGAITRFDRGAIEIRIVDIQECPRADMAIVAMIVAVVKALTELRWGSLEELHSLHTEMLASLFVATLTHGGNSVISSPDLMRVLGIRQEKSMSAGEIWDYLLKELLLPEDLAGEGWGSVLKTILKEGPLASRILKATGPEPSRAALKETYSRLQTCLAEGRMFHA